MTTRMCVFGLMSVLALGTWGSQASAEMVIATEDFDGSGTWNNNIAGQFFHDPDPNASEHGLYLRMADEDNLIINGQDFSDRFNDNFDEMTLFANDLMGEGNEPTIDEFEFEFDEVDVSNFENLAISFDYTVMFATDDAAFYEIFVDGESMGQVDFYNDPRNIFSGTVTEFINGPASSVSLMLSGTLDGDTDAFELDNFTITGDMISAVPEPMTAATFVIGMGLISRRRRS